MPDNFTDLIMSVASKGQLVVSEDGYVCSGIHYQVYAFSIGNAGILIGFYMNNLANIKSFLANLFYMPVLLRDIGLYQIVF